MSRVKKNFQELVSGDHARERYPEEFKNNEELAKLGRDTLLLAFPGVYGNIYVGKSFSRLFNPIEPVVCPSTNAIYISNSVTDIGDNAFKGCDRIKFFMVTQNVKHIGAYAFSGCNLNFIAMRPRFKDIKIDKKAFENCLLRRVIIFKEEDASKWGEFFKESMGYTPYIEDKNHKIFIKASRKLKELSEDSEYRKKNLEMSKVELPFKLAYYKHLKETHSILLEDFDEKTRRENDMEIWNIEHPDEEIKSKGDSNITQPSLPFDKSEVPYLDDDEGKNNAKDKDPQFYLPFDKCM